MQYELRSSALILQEKTLCALCVQSILGFGMKLIYAIFAVVFFTSTASAQELVYEPVNPSFGGNPFNSSHLLSIANAQNDFERSIDEDESTDFDRFIRSLESRLLSSLSTQVANAIFGDDAQDNGTIRFGDQTISFVRTLDGIELTLTDSDGTVTVITIPTFQTGDGDTDGAASLSDDGPSVANVGKVSINSGQGLSVDGALTYQPLLTDNGLKPIQQPIQ